MTWFASTRVAQRTARPEREADALQAERVCRSAKCRRTAVTIQLSSGGSGGADERGAEEEVDRGVEHVPCGARGNEIDEGAGDGAGDAESSGVEPMLREVERYGSVRDATQSCAEAAMRLQSERRVRAEEEAEEKNLAAEPGAAPHLQARHA